MTESLLIKISLVLSIIGIIILFFISDKIKPKEYQISFLSKEQLEELVKIKGQITDIKELKDLTVLTIKDKSGLIKVTLLKNNQIIKPKKGQEVEVIGKFRTFRKDFEIEAQEIKIL